MVKLKVIGRRNQRTFRVIVQEDREKLEGKFAEDLGWYNPKTAQFKLNKDRVAYWIGNGAKPTESVAKLLEKVKDSEIGGFEGKEGRKRKKGKRKVEAEAQAKTAAEAPASEAVAETSSTDSGQAVEEAVAPEAEAVEEAKPAEAEVAEEAKVEEVSSPEAPAEAPETSEETPSTSSEQEPVEEAKEGE